MDTSTLNEYRAIRQRNPRLPAKQALLWAKGNDKPLTLDWDTFPSTGHVAVGTGERDGFDIVATVDYDEYRTTDLHFTDDPASGIRNPRYVHGGYGRESFSDKKFVELESDYTVRQLAEDFREQGDSKNVAWERAYESLVKEAKGYLGDDYIMVVVNVEVKVDGVTLGEAGIGSDFILWQPGTSFERDLDDCVAEGALIEEAIEDAGEKLASIIAKQKKRLARMEALTA